MEGLMRILGKGKRGKAGFTLIELMIVVIIIGILAAAAVPIYRGFVARAYTSEAKATVGTIRSAEQVYRVEHGEWLTDNGNGFSDTDNTAIESILDTLNVEINQNTWFNNAGDVAFYNVGGVAADTGTTYSTVNSPPLSTGVAIICSSGDAASAGAAINFDSGNLVYTTDGGDTWKE